MSDENTFQQAHRTWVDESEKVMGTNFYAYENTCECFANEKLHIGKSSAGWCFSIHVIPEKGLNNLEDWKKKLLSKGVTIQDEYGDILTPEEMFDKIENKGEGTKRHRIYDDHCAGNYDYIQGEFS